MTTVDPSPYVVPLLAATAVWLWPRPTRARHRARRAVPGGMSPELPAILLVVVVGWLNRSLVVIILGVSALGFVRVWLARRQRRRASLELDAAMITLADDLGQQLRGGGVLASSFSSRVATDARLHDPFGEAAAAVAVGASLEAELQRVAEHDTRDAVRLVAVALSVLVGSGGPALQALERLGQRLRDRRASVDERQLQSSQARASAVVLGVLPIVFAIVAASIEPDLRHFYLHRLPGALCLVAMLGLVASCWLWIDLLTGERG